MNALRMALDSIREKKGRSFLTMLGIIIGVTAVLVLVALVSGYNADITAYYEKLGVNKVNVTVNWYDTSRSVDVMDTLYDYGNGELGDMVLGVSPDLSTSLPMKYRTTTLDSGTLYLGSDQFSVCGNYTLKEGRDISAFDVDRRSRVCVLGSYVADSLFQYADPIGETVYFGGEPFTVVGIYYQKDGGEEGSMDDMAVIPYSLDRAILGTAQLTRFSVKVDQSDQDDKQRHLHGISHTSHKATQCQRTGVSHKYLGRIYIKQKKSHQTADNCTGDRFHTTVHSKGNHRKEYCHDQGNTGSQSVKSIRKIDSVYCTDHRKEQYRNRKPSQVQIMSAPKRDLHSQGYVGIIYKIKSKYSCHNDLQCHFLPWQKSVRTLQNYLQIIIQKSDQSKSQCQEKYRDDHRIISDIKQ